MVSGLSARGELSSAGNTALSTPKARPELSLRQNLQIPTFPPPHRLQLNTPNPLNVLHPRFLGRKLPTSFLSSQWASHCPYFQLGAGANGATPLFAGALMKSNRSPLGSI